MSIIFTPEKDVQLFAPFGPTMGYYRMPEELVDNLNSKMSDRLDDYSDNLVGKVSTIRNISPFCGPLGKCVPKLAFASFASASDTTFNTSSISDCIADMCLCSGIFSGTAISFKNSCSSQGRVLI